MNFDHFVLLSAGLSMTGVWSSLMLETWPTPPKSSEVCRNVLVTLVRGYTHTHTHTQLYRNTHILFFFG